MGLASASFDAQFGDKNTDLVAICPSDRNDCAKSAIKQLPVRCTARFRKDFDKSIASCQADKTLTELSACLREAKAAMKSPSFAACKDAKSIIARRQKISVPTATTPACKVLAKTCPDLFKKVNS
jgi:hypothetical protein